MILSFQSTNGRSDRGGPGGVAAKLVGLGEWLFPSQNGNFSAFNDPCRRGVHASRGCSLGVLSITKPIMCQGEVVEESPWVSVKNHHFTTKYLLCALWLSRNLSLTSSSPHPRGPS